VTTSFLEAEFFSIKDARNGDLGLKKGPAVSGGVVVPQVKGCANVVPEKGSARPATTRRRRSNDPGPKRSGLITFIVQAIRSAY